MPSLVEIVSIAPTVHLDLRYATTNNIAKRVLYPKAKAYMIPDAAESLQRVQQSLTSHNLSLVVWDAYRPLSVSRALWRATPESQKHYVADPNIGSNHNRGCAADLTLLDMQSGQQVDMPSSFDDFSERASPDFDDTDKQRAGYRDLLKGLMEANGFIVNKHEWWHYDWQQWTDYPILDIPIEEL